MRRAGLLFVLVAFLVTTFGPTAALALARATGDAPVVVELCSTSGIKRVLLSAVDDARSPSAPGEDARPAPADCKYCKLLSPTLAPPPAARVPTLAVSEHERLPEARAAARALVQGLTPPSRAPPTA